MDSTGFSGLQPPDTEPEANNADVSLLSGFSFLQSPNSSSNDSFSLSTFLNKWDLKFPLNSTLNEEPEITPAEMHEMSVDSDMLAPFNCSITPIRAADSLRHNNSSLLSISTSQNSTNSITLKIINTESLNTGFNYDHDLSMYAKMNDFDSSSESHTSLRSSCQSINEDNPVNAWSPVNFLISSPVKLPTWPPANPPTAAVNTLTSSPVETLTSEIAKPSLLLNMNSAAESPDDRKLKSSERHTSRKRKRDCKRDLNEAFYEDDDDYSLDSSGSQSKKPRLDLTQSVLAPFSLLQHPAKEPEANNTDPSHIFGLSYLPKRCPAASPCKIS